MGTRTMLHISPTDGESSEERRLGVSVPGAPSGQTRAPAVLAEPAPTAVGLGAGSRGGGGGLWEVRAGAIFTGRFPPYQREQMRCIEFQKGSGPAFL